MSIDRKKPRKRKSSEGAPAISKTIAGLRLETGLTQQKAASGIGISVVTLRRIESGDLRVSARNLEKILNFFDMTLTATPRQPTEIKPTGDRYPTW